LDSLLAIGRIFAVDTSVYDLCNHTNKKNFSTSLMQRACRANMLRKLQTNCFVEGRDPDISDVKFCFKMFIIFV
jgi:hypothetical protein